LRVALTFDTEHAGRPAPSGVEQRLLDALASAGVRGTFFLQGRWARAYPEQARRIAEAGHLIANHSHHHAPMDALTDEGLRADVRAAEETIRSVTGVDPKPWFRCPFGSGMEDRRVLGLLGELGYRHVGWDADPRDWEEGRTTDELVGRVLDAARARDDSIVLLHGWPGVTAQGLPLLLDALAASGAEFVDVGALSQRTTAR
jgi:peptidoglycan-N-acetylglucosamine deacetylase